MLKYDNVSLLASKHSFAAQPSRFITRNGWVGKCQESWHPQLIYAACFSRSGFSITSPICCQFLVLPDQRSGSCAFAIWYTSSRFFSTVPSFPRCRWQGSGRDRLFLLHTKKYLPGSHWGNSQNYQL